MRATISHIEALSHFVLPDVKVFPLSESAMRGKPQEVLVYMAPEAIIPLHTHETDAQMIIVAGAGTVLSEDPVVNGTQVERGSCVFFEKLKPHGFKAGQTGLTFLSRNGGIVDAINEWDILFTPAG